MEPAGTSGRRDSQADFSLSVHKKLKSSARTGQACDRCKVRKIRCDASAGSCEPCRLAHQPCKTTDRISGKALYRGHTDVLEHENRLLKEKLQRCHQLLQNYGIAFDDGDLSSPVQPQSASSNDFPSNVHAKSQPVAASSSSHLNSQNIISVIPLITNPTLPETHPDLKLFRGTKLDLFGMQIDGAEFDDEFEDTDTVKSYQGLIAAQKAAQANPNELDEVARIPESKSRALDWTKWYFMAIHPFVPGIHKADMYSLVHKIYSHDSLNVAAFKALPIPSKVLLHIMFALIKHQVAQRNNLVEPMDDAVHHFVTAMTFFARLLQNQTVAHAQALVMLAAFARNYMKPEAAWFILHPAMWACIEQGLHRSASTLPEEERKRMTPHDVEMRKRIFWIVFGISSLVSGRLGRPLPIRIQDVDIEFPEPLSDCLPEETDIPDGEKCSFLVTIVGVKLASIMAQLYSNMFAVRRNPQIYEADLAQLEGEHKAWQATIPPELNLSTCSPATKVFALYLTIWDLEFQFFLHHPAVYRNSAHRDVQLKKSLEVCNKYLLIAEELRAMRWLDSQWVFVSMLLAVMFTTLFIYDVRKDDVTLEDFQKLIKDMQIWQRIFGDAGEMQGIGSKLQQSSHKIIARYLQVHQQRLATKASPLNQSAQPTVHNGRPTHHANGVESANNNTRTYQPKVRNNFDQQTYDTNNAALRSTPQQPTQPYYTEPTTSPTSSIPYNHTMPYGNAPYQTATADASVQFNGGSNPSAYYGMPAGDMAPNGNMMDHWLRWTQQNINTYDPQALAHDYLNPASSLVALSERGTTMDDGVTAGAAPPVEEVRFWPPHYLLGHGGPSTNMGNLPKMGPP